MTLSQTITHHAFDVVVVGAGSAGIAAAVSAANAGARTALVEAGPLLGGELLTGMTIDGAISAVGQQINGGFMDCLLERCESMGGFVRKLSDWRLIQYVAYDPEFMKMAITQTVFESGVKVFLHTFAEDVVAHEGRVDAIMVRNKSGRAMLSGKVFIDCSGDGDICAAAGAPMLPKPDEESLQPVSMMFRMSGVETAPLLDLVCAHPEYFAMGESDAIRGGRTDPEIAEELRRQGQPCVFIKGDGPLLGDAIKRKEMYPTALIMIQPTSEARKEVCINSTRITLDNPTGTADVARALAEIMRQVDVCTTFLRNNVAGFENATLSGLAPKLGIRETRRVEGDYILTSDDVTVGRKFDDGVAKGCHHIDIHGDGTEQIRIPIADGGSYDIPYRSLVPKSLSNVLMAGRCFSADRPAHGSARVMGGCMAMGQATGIAAEIACRQNSDSDVRKVDPQALRNRLTDVGAILTGVR